MMITTVTFRERSLFNTVLLLSNMLVEKTAFLLDLLGFYFLFS